MNIRQAQPDDARAIAEVHYRSWRAAYRDIMAAEAWDSISLEDRRERWKSNLAERPKPTLVIEEAEKIVGFASYGPVRDDDVDPERVWEIYGLYLDPDVWGRGLGRELVRGCLRDVGRRGIGEATLWVLDTNEAAQRFYEAVGFKLDPGAHHVRVVAGVELSHLRYRIADLDLVSRPATNADGDRVRDLVFSILTEYNLKPDPTTTDADLDDLEGNYEKRGGCFDLLETHSGDLIGTVGLYPVDEETVELRKMYLRKDYRGRGLGKRLLEQSLEKAQTLGFRRVTLETAFVLREAVALYERYGFKPYTPEHMSDRCDQCYELRFDG